MKRATVRGGCESITAPSLHASTKRPTVKSPGVAGRSSSQRSSVVLLRRTYARGGTPLPRPSTRYPRAGSMAEIVPSVYGGTVLVISARLESQPAIPNATATTAKPSRDGTDNSTGINIQRTTTGRVSSAGPLVIPVEAPRCCPMRRMTKRPGVSSRVSKVCWRISRSEVQTLPPLL